MSAEGLIAVFISARPALARFLATRGAQAAECEDILQDIYVKLIEQATGPVAEPRAYLYRMTHNLLLDRHRAAGRRHQREDAWVGSQTGAFSDRDDRPSIETVLFDRERLATVTDALATLPERSIEILRRYRLDGDTQKTIAHDLGLSLSAVEKHLQRAYRVLLEARRGLDAENEPPCRLTGEGRKP